MITRLAPTPSGFLHEGNIYNFLINWLWARANGGKVWLRIDDADVQRKRPEYVEDIFIVLEWMGLYWDIGPEGPDALESVWSQTHRRPIYESLLSKLAEKNQLYACTCSRTQMKSARQPCLCYEQSLPLNTHEAAWKMKMDDTAVVSIPNEKNAAIDTRLSLFDFVVRKKDLWPAYAITSLADDMEFGVTHIARGLDLLESTARQFHIARQLPDTTFTSVHCWHHDLLLDDTQEKISKSAGFQSQSIINTTTPELIVERFVAWLGADPNTYRTLKDLQRYSLFQLS